MEATSFAEANGYVDKPEQLTYDQCQVLTTWTGMLVNGIPATISCWKPTREELAEIERTGRVWLVVLGHGMPPVHITGHKPFEEAPACTDKPG